MNENSMKADERSSISVSKARRDDFEAFRVVLVAELRKMITQDEALGILLSESKAARKKRNGDK